MLGGRSITEEVFSGLYSQFCLFGQVWRKPLHVASQEESIMSDTERQCVYCSDRLAWWHEIRAGL